MYFLVVTPCLDLMTDIFGFLPATPDFSKLTLSVCIEFSPPCLCNITFFNSFDSPIKSTVLGMDISERYFFEKKKTPLYMGFVFLN